MVADLVYVIDSVGTHVVFDFATKEGQHFFSFFIFVFPILNKKYTNEMNKNLRFHN